MRWLVGLAAGGALVAFLLAPSAQAQETPVPTDATAQETPVPTDEGTPADATPPSQGTPTGVPETGLRIEIVAEEEPVPSGDRFEVQIFVDNVEHLSAFDFVLQYDPDRLLPVAEGGEAVATPSTDPATEGEANVLGELGQFLETSPRGESATCQGPYTLAAQRGNVLALCASIAPPVCLGGPDGASGSGMVGTVTFEARGGDMTTLRLVSSNLISDDVPPPCDPDSDSFIPQRIAHTTSEATVLLKSSEGGISTLLLIAIVAVVVVVVLGGGGAAYYWYQRRSASQG
ncbi:MAG: cohesin domain-containing protein [Dehalococcoidia bacterium]